MSLNAVNVRDTSKTEETSVIRPSRWRKSLGYTRASADVWGIYRVSRQHPTGRFAKLRPGYVALRPPFPSPPSFISSVSSDRALPSGSNNDH